MFCNNLVVSDAITNVNLSCGWFWKAASGCYLDWTLLNGSALLQLANNGSLCQVPIYFCLETDENDAAAENEPKPEPESEETEDPEPKSEPEPEAESNSLLTRISMCLALILFV